MQSTSGSKILSKSWHNECPDEFYKCHVIVHESKHNTNCAKVSSISSRAKSASKFKKCFFVLVLFLGIQYFSDFLLKVNYKTMLWKRNSVEPSYTTETNIDNIKGQLFIYNWFLKWRNETKRRFPWTAGYRTKYAKNMPLCLRNDSLLGPAKVNKTVISMEWAENHTTGVKPGGISAPTRCRAKHKVAILVPYRNREENVPIFLYHLHKHLKKQYLDYTVFIIEQSEKDKFNKGSLYNAGYMVTQLMANWTCLIFHDVDMVPLDERILYTCPRRPTHMSTIVERLGFRMQYRFLFGGVTAMKPQVYEEVNGYSNYYFDWGAEDDDMVRRLRYSRHSIYRISQKIGRYASLPHVRNRINPKKWWVLQQSKRRYQFEGLQSTIVSVLNVTKRPLFTHVLVDINPFNDTLPYSV